ncbi:MAG: 2Fe-2S iron-sulfur cluster-binding protein [Sandaracinaceae bacterium]
MATVFWNEERIEVKPGARLRDALLSAGHSPHNGGAQRLNCRGLGSCGTCAVRVHGVVEPVGHTRMEAWRLGFPPHDKRRGLRLACQVRVRGDIRIEKLEGFWGQGTEADTP